MLTSAYASGAPFDAALNSADLRAGQHGRDALTGDRCKIRCGSMVTGEGVDRSC
jgi:hypothetical protein